MKPAEMAAGLSRSGALMWWGERSKGMPFFKKKPVVVEARQFTERDWKVMEPIVLWMRDNGQAKAFCSFVLGQIYIPTLEGEMTASVGDWIIKGVNGEFYPCKPDIFAKTYEPEQKT